MSDPEPLTTAAPERFGADLVFGLAFGAIRRGLGRFVILFLLSILATGVIFGAVGAIWAITSVPGQPDLRLPQSPAFWLFMAVAMPIYMLAMLWLHLVMVALAYAVMRQRPARLGALFALAWRRFWPALGSGLLAMAGIFLGLLLFIVPGVILMVRWWVWVPACLVEGQGAGAALKRSAALTKGRRWIVFLLLLVTLLVAGALNQLADALVEVAAGFAILSVLIYGFTTTFWSVLSAAIYVGLRDRSATAGLPDLVAAG